VSIFVIGRQPARVHAGSGWPKTRQIPGCRIFRDRTGKSTCQGFVRAPVQCRGSRMSGNGDTRTTPALTLLRPLRLPILRR